MSKSVVLVLVLLVLGAGAGGYLIRGNSAGSNTSNDSTQVSTQKTDSTNGKRVSYANRGLSEFPKEVLKDKSTTVLDLSGNNLTGAIPAEIKDLSNLVELNLSNNNMTGIPAEIGQLKKLKILNYSNNNITGLPMELGNLTQLELFDLSGNNASTQDLSKIRAKLVNTEINI